MNASKIFGIVLLGHVVAFAIILIQPGCQSGPRERPILGPDATERDRAGATEDEDYWVYDEGETRDVREGAPRTERPRAAPRRPETTRTGEFDDDFIRPETPAQPDRPAPGPVDFGEDAEIYTVVRGDTLSTIARRHQVSLNSLLQANDLRMNSVIQPGQELVIPEGGVTVRPTTEPAPAEGTSEYTVRRGDTLSTIAQRHGTTVARLRELNNLQGDMIRAEQTLRVPSAEGAPAAPREVSRETARRPASGVVYTVQAGDTPGAIANRFDVSTQELMRANNISDPRRMRVGQELVIPGREEPAEEPETRTREREPRERREAPEETDPPAPDRSLPVRPAEEEEDFEDFDDFDFPEVELVPE